jgi:uncharacterized protein
MALLEKFLQVKESTIPNSGKGLFTRKFIPSGTRIVEYKGKITDWNSVKNNSDNGYIYSVNNKHVIDAGKHLKAFARYANDARGITRVKGITNNCHYVNDGVRVFIEAIRDIPAGGELFVAYGKEYWDVVRNNIRIDAREEKLLKKKSAKKKKSTAPKKRA